MSSKSISYIKNNKNFLSEREYKTIQILFDFLFYDQTKYYASYSRFEECFSFLQLQLNLFEIFKEIIGLNKKYLTIPRFINKYLEYKTGKSKLSFPLKKFFVFIMNSLIKDWKVQHAGFELNNPTYSSNNCENYNRLSDLILLQGKNNEIKGLQLFYDDIFPCNLFNERSTEPYYKCFEIPLLYLDEFKSYDSITHIFGCYTNKINYIGFKCKSGIMKTFGEKSGTPFLFGDYGNELKTLKIQVTEEKGMNMILPNFTESSITNVCIDNLPKDLKLTDKLGDYLIFEENIFKDSQRISDEIIKYNLIKDYNPENIDLSIRTNTERINKNEKNGRKQRTKSLNVDREPKNNFIENINKDILLNEAEELYTNQNNQIYKRQSLQNDTFNTSKAKDINENDNSINTSRIKNDNNGSFISNKSKNVEKWVSPSVKNVNIRDLISSKENYNKIVEILKMEIQREIDYELNKYDYDKRFDFYDEYLFKNSLLEPYPIAPKKYESYTEIKDIEIDFKTFNEIIKEKNSINDDDSLYLIKDSDKNLYDLKRIYCDWRILSKLLYQLHTTSSIISMIALMKAIKIIESIEENYFDENFSLEEKIKIYKALVNNERTVNYYLNNVQPQSKIKRGILINQKPEFFEENNEYYNDMITEDEINNNDIIKVSQKLNSIKKIMEKDMNNFPKLSLLYNKYKKIQNILIDKMNKEQESKILSSIKLDYNENLEEMRKTIEKEPVKLNQKEIVLIMPNGDINTSSFVDLDIQNEYTNVFKKQEIPQDTTEEFNDPLFPADYYSLGYIENYDVKWEKADMILYTNNFKILPPTNEFEGTNYHINTGILTNYYYLNGIYALLKYPSIIYKLFPFYEKSINGLYGINLRIDGIWKMVLIDESFPCIDNRKENKFFAFSSINAKHIWLNLIEKAYAKICGGYTNILNGNVSEIFDLLTDAPTNKIEIASLKRDDIKNIIEESLNEKYIICAKANNSSSFSVGLIPGNNYIINDLKKFNIGISVEHLILMKNIFGSQKYYGNWSKNSKKWIPSLKNQIPKNENEFFISLDDFYIYFSVLYICKIYPSESETPYFSSNLHYSKDEIIQPNITLLNILKDDTKINIQFHQKNPKFNQFINLMPSFILITDEYFKYINSITSNERNFSIDCTLNQGKYYIYSDIICRYIVKNVENFHGYTLCTYSNNKVELEKSQIDLNDIYSVLKICLEDYSLKYLNPKKCDMGFLIYDSSEPKEKYRNFTKNKFPFLFNIFDNKNGEFEQEITIIPDKIYKNSVKDYAFYLDNEDKNSLQKNEENIIYQTLSQKDNYLVMLLKLNENFNFKIKYQPKVKISNDELKEYIMKKGLREELDEEGMIIQYMMEYDNGFVVLIQNKYEDDDLKMKFIMKGLKCIWPNTNDLEIFYFTLKKNNTKLFKLKLSEKNISGIVSFQFQFA